MLIKKFLNSTALTVYPFGRLKFRLWTRFWTLNLRRRSAWKIYGLTHKASELKCPKLWTNFVSRFFRAYRFLPESNAGRPQIASHQKPAKFQFFQMNSPCTLDPLCLLINWTDSLLFAANCVCFLFNMVFLLVNLVLIWLWSGHNLVIILIR